MPKHKTIKFPASRIATLDVGEIGKRKHHVSALIEVDVTDTRKKIKENNRANNERVSFNAMLISIIAATIKEYESSAAWLKGKSNIIIFEDINVSFLIEKQINGERVPMPLLIEKANERSAFSISKQIEDSKKEELKKGDIVLQRKSGSLERLYYKLPGYLRRTVWRYMLKRPVFAFKQMGNVSITSIGMMGKISGWFIPISVHPLCFGIGSIMKKPVVVENEIRIREMLHISVLMDHDVMDGANMARFISELQRRIEKGIYS